MQKVLLLLLIMVFLGATVQATTYSCRGKQGRLYMTDNLQTLPVECRGRMQVVEPQDPDNLNYVPAQAVQEKKCDAALELQFPGDCTKSG